VGCKVTQKGKIIIPIHKPDIVELLFFFTCGAVISVPLTLFIYQYASLLLVGLEPFRITLISSIIFAPLIEEFAKAYPLFYRHGETSRSIFNLGVLVGFGFGIVELITYISLGASAIGRLPGIFFHPASTSITAYGIAKNRPLLFYVVAVSLHFTYNLLVLMLPFGFSPAIFVTIISVILSWQLRERTKEQIVI
jgi:RsiW-degrading membrane proteinase PrsW (M82 family)